MYMTNRRIKSPPAERTVRASISFPEDEYAELERIAQHQRVSLAWVVREAVHSYLVARWPLLDEAEHSQTTDILLPHAHTQTRL
jgi:metal-responsive CopG/Arc/MetJ family transcriptional regulator